MADGGFLSGAFYSPTATVLLPPAEHEKIPVLTTITPARLVPVSQDVYTDIGNRFEAARGGPSWQTELKKSLTYSAAVWASVYAIGSGFMALFPSAYSGTTAGAATAAGSSASGVSSVPHYTVSGGPLYTGPTEAARFASSFSPAYSSPYYSPVITPSTTGLFATQPLTSGGLGGLFDKIGGWLSNSLSSAGTSLVSSTVMKSVLGKGTSTLQSSIFGEKSTHTAGRNSSVDRLIPDPFGGSGGGGGQGFSGYVPPVEASEGVSPIIKLFFISGVVVLGFLLLKRGMK